MTNRVKSAVHVRLASAVTFFYALRLKRRNKILTSPKWGQLFTLPGISIETIGRGCAQGPGGYETRACCD